MTVLITFSILIMINSHIENIYWISNTFRDSVNNSDFISFLFRFIIKSTFDFKIIF